jgi:nucleoside-diphosphate-sugar epimerase
VYASSVAAYGFHPDNPVGMTEDWATRPADRLFYAQEKAELEQLLHDAAAAHPETALYLLRPPIVLGPDALGGKAQLPGQLAGLARMLRSGLGHVPVPVAVPRLPLQLIHQDDVAEAIHLCVLGAGPPGAYNIAADDVISGVDVARELGLLPVPLPARPAHAAARALSRVPLLPHSAQWVEALSHPAIMDTTRAKQQLGWQPRHTARDALLDSLP